MVLECFQQNKIICFSSLMDNTLPENIKWKVVPRHHEPQKTIQLALIVGCILIGSLILTRSPILTILAFLLIGSLTAEFWLGTQFSITNEKVSAKIAFSEREMKWSDAVSIYLVDNVLVVSPIHEDSRLHSVRGVRMVLTPENREDVLTFIRDVVGKDVRLLGG